MENDYAGFNEEQVLHQIFIDEQFPVDDTASKAKAEKEKLAGSKVAIGYDYNEVGIRFPIFLWVKRRKKRKLPITVAYSWYF